MGAALTAVAAAADAALDARAEAIASAVLSDRFAAQAAADDAAAAAFAAAQAAALADAAFLQPATSRQGFASSLKTLGSLTFGALLRRLPGSNADASESARESWLVGRQTAQPSTGVRGLVSRLRNKAPCHSLREPPPDPWAELRHRIDAERRRSIHACHNRAFVLQQPEQLRSRHDLLVREALQPRQSLQKRKSPLQLLSDIRSKRKQLASPPKQGSVVVQWTNSFAPLTRITSTTLS